ncbi:MAG: hypothetical protein AseanaTS_21430 [Candidatus Pelagadaptatus aseana]|uniref:DUF2802 domain-containing protein n=1 Tax=Candidatus Pelagadaptatus aseana TaxID=3120508 RepID=UPI0039B2A4ED
MSSTMWMNFALIGSIGISWMALALAMVCYGRLRKQSLLTQRLYQRLDHNLQMTNNGSIGMGRRLIALEKQLQQIDAAEAANEVASENLVQVAEAETVVATDKAPNPIEGLAPDLADAARLLNAGLNTEEVARRCGISRAEASLMELMHSQVKNAAA